MQGVTETGEGTLKYRPLQMGYTLMHYYALIHRLALQKQVQ